MVLLIVMSIVTVIYTALNLSLPFLFQNLQWSSDSGLFLTLLYMNIFEPLFLLFLIPCFHRYTRIYNRQNEDTTIALSKEKHRVKSLADIEIEKCGSGIWKFYANDNTYEINLKDYLFQTSFVMAIMTRLVFYRYIKNGKLIHFASHAKVPIKSLEIQIKMPNNKIRKKKLVRHNRLCHGIIAEDICHCQIRYDCVSRYRIFEDIHREHQYVKYKEEWWARGLPRYNKEKKKSSEEDT